LATTYKILDLLVIKGYPKGGFDLSLMDKVFLPYLIHSSKNIFTPLLSFWLGYKPFVIPYVRQPRMYGKSRWTFEKKFKAFLFITSNNVSLHS
jgi:dolichol-phosphate mannosyltransferase